MAWPVTSPRASKSNTSVFATLFTREKNILEALEEHIRSFFQWLWMTARSRCWLQGERFKVLSCAKKRYEDLSRNLQMSRRHPPTAKDKARQKTEASIFKGDGCMLRKLTEKRISHRREIPEGERQRQREATAADNSRSAFSAAALRLRGPQPVNCRRQQRRKRLRTRIALYG